MYQSLTSPKPISLYWKCQLYGWLTAGLYWGFQAFISGPFSIIQFVWQLLGDMLIGILLTHLYSRFALARKWTLLEPRRLLPRLVCAVLLLGLAFMVLTACKLYLVRRCCMEGYHEPFAVFFRSAALTLGVTGVRLMAIWVLAYHLYHFALREITVVKDNARLALIAKEAQLNNLAAQLNPHFFFNSLNNIKFLVNDNPASARRAIDLLSELLRHSLYSRNDLLVPLQDELQLVQDYLELEKLRLEERLQTSIRVDKNMLMLPVPPLCVQTLVENAIKHGIAGINDGGTVGITVSTADGWLCIRVQNPCSGNAVRGNGVGLQNLQNRLQLQYAGKASLQMEVQELWVCVTLLIPVV
jgi:hypothetical protein